MRSLALAFLSLIFFADEVSAASGPISREFPANDVTIPQPWERNRCTYGRGNVLSIVSECPDQYCLGAANLFAERRNAAGELLGARIRINTDPAEGWSASVYCNRAGDFVVAYDGDPEDGVCSVVRSFSHDGRALTAPVPLLACSAVYQLAISLYDDGAFVAVWTEWADAAQSRELRARTFSADATPLSDPVTVNTGMLSWPSWPSVAVDESRYALVAWSNGPDEETRIIGRAIDPDGRLYGDAFEVTETPAPWNVGGEIREDGGGIFTVFWFDFNHGGQVGRRVAVDADAAPVTTTTTLPLPPEDMPEFGPARILSTHSGEQLGSSLQPELYAGADAAWYISTGNQLLRTYEDARHWGTPAELPPHEPWQRALATDGQGDWVLVYAPYNEPALLLRRSQDDGSSWSEAQAIASWDYLSPECDYCQIQSVDVEMDAGGTLVAAWSFFDYYEWAHDGPEGIARIYTAASHDGGATWSDAALVSTAGTAEYDAFDLETDGRGTWILMWMDPSGEFGAPKRILEVRSTDDGHTWSPIAVVAEGPPNLGSWGFHWLQLAGSGGQWVAVFGSPELNFDVDRDVYSIRSVDGGVTWEDPIPLNLYAANDGSTDFDPSIATDGAGHWLAVWASHHPLGGLVGLDAEILAALSTDAGATWSTPVPVDSAAGSDTWYDDAPRVSADERGVWMVAWQSQPKLPIHEIETRTIQVAVAGDHCRDDLLDTGEECDDGNAVEGDGCDSNCTHTACGNGVVTAGEPCDDGNPSNQDACLVGCVVASCGDGFVHASVEECDDGNASDRDGCTIGCRVARCGDGFTRIGVEQCDDANPSSTDDCTIDCELATCGDGYVHAGIEQCDDANTSDYDSCVSGCRVAACGDGWIDVGFEECDPARDSDKEFCTPECVISDACGDADGNGVALASDALRILQTAVGTEAICPIHSCDVDGAFGITAADAQLCLRIVVGAAPAQQCPLRQTVVFLLTDAVRYGALQLSMDYGQGGGTFSDLRGRTRCETLLPGVLAAYSDDTSSKLLNMGIVSNAGFEGPADIARCAYKPADGVGLILRIETRDAADVDGQPITSPAAVTYRVE